MSHGFEITEEDVFTVLSAHRQSLAVADAALESLSVELFNQLDISRSEKAALDTDLTDLDDFDAELMAQTESAHQDILAQLTEMGVIVAQPTRISTPKR